MALRDALGLLRLLPRHPRQFADAVSARTQTAWEERMLPPPAYSPAGQDEAIDGLERALGVALRRHLAEPALEQAAAHVRSRVPALAAEGPFPTAHNGGIGLGQVLWALVRALKPAVVVETGVAYGVSSTFLLAALAQNGSGELHSIDRPPPGEGSRDWIGALVPDELRGAWRLHRGSSARLLPGVVRQAGPVGLFLHDSRHTYRNITAELTAVRPALSPRAAVLADDIERNVAFERWARREAGWWAAVRQADKPGLWGAAVPGPAR